MSGNGSVHMRKFDEAAFDRDVSHVNQPLITVNGRTYSPAEIAMIVTLSEEVVVGNFDYKRFAVLIDQLRRFVFQEGN